MTITVKVARWRNGYSIGLAISRSRVQILLRATLRNNLGQAVHTYLPLSPSSITWYRPKGGDALRLGWVTYGHLRVDCLYTRMSSKPNARYRVWEAFTFFITVKASRQKGYMTACHEVCIALVKLPLPTVLVLELPLLTFGVIWNGKKWETAIPITGVLITPAQSVRDLGIYTDADLSMQAHVKRKVSRCFASPIALDLPSGADSHVPVACIGSGTLTTQLRQYSTGLHPSLPGTPFAVGAHAAARLVYHLSTRPQSLMC